MFLDESGVAVLFRLINLSVFIFFVAYIFKKYLLDTIKKRITDEKQTIIDLHHKADTLVSEINSLERAIHQDERTCRELKARVVEWRAQAERVSQERAERKQAQLKTLADHVHTQVEHLQRTRAYESILPTVIDRTHKKLQATFENEAAAHAFISQLITFMQKGG